MVPEVELLAYQDLYTGFQECAASEKERIQDAGGSASDMSLQVRPPQGSALNPTHYMITGNSSEMPALERSPMQVYPCDRVLCARSLSSL